MSKQLFPQWRGVMPAFIAVLEDGEPAGRAIARDELMRVARTLDEIAIVLPRVLSFIEGFEDDPLQQGVPELLAQLRQFLPQPPLPSYRDEFPDFDFIIPDVVTTSWRFVDASDEAERPTFICDVFTLVIDYADPDRRLPPENAQFVMRDEGRLVLSTNSWEDVRAFVEDGVRA